MGDTSTDALPTDLDTLLAEIQAGEDETAVAEVEALQTPEPVEPG